MDKFEEKYGYKEDGAVKSYHTSRRMWAVKKGKLYVAEPNLDYSHAQWFEQMGWPETDMDELTRGIVDDKGNVYFYVGYDFLWSERAEKEALSILKELAEKLLLAQTAKVYGGLVKGEPGTQWPADKEYGELKDLIAPVK